MNMIDRRPDTAHLAHMKNRPWAQTRSGRAFPLVDPDPSDVYWPDIAFALSYINRHAGNVGQYSDAQHSVLVADTLLPEWRPYGLLHDAHEFVFGDMTSPAKWAMEHYAAKWAGEVGESCVSAAILNTKNAIDKAIYGAAGLCWPIPQEIVEAVHVADQRVLMTELRDLHAPPPGAWGYDDVVPLPKVIMPESPQTAMTKFVLALRECGIGLDQL